MEAFLLLKCGSRDQISTEVDELPMGCEKLSQFLLNFYLPRFKCHRIRFFNLRFPRTARSSPLLCAFKSLTHVKCWIFLDFNLK